MIPRWSAQAEGRSVAVSRGVGRGRSRLPTGNGEGLGTTSQGPIKRGKPYQLSRKGCGG